MRRYLAALLRFKWVLAAALVIAVAGALLAWRSTTLQYRAQGSLWISSGGQAQGGAGPISQGDLLDSYAWLDLLRSFSVLDPVVVEQRLYISHDPAFGSLFETFRIQEGAQFRPGPYKLEVDPAGGSYTLTTGEGLMIETGRAGQPIGTSLGFEWHPSASLLTPELATSFFVLNPRDAAVQLRQALEADMDGLGTFIQLGLRDRDPERASGVLASVMERTVDVARVMSRGRLDETNKILAEQLQIVEEDLRESERELESFRVQTITLPTETSSAITPGLEQTRLAVLDQFFGLRMELEDVSRDRERLEGILNSEDGIEFKVAALELIPAVQQSSQLVQYLQELSVARSSLATLRGRYTEEHELVRAERDRVTSLAEVEIPRAAETVLLRLRTRESELSGVIDNRSDELAQIPPRMIEEARLERRVQIATSLYVELRQRFETSSLASRSTVPEIQILDRPAVPTVPDGDERARWALMAFAGVFGLALGLVLLIDRMDPKLRDPFDVTSEIGLPILATVPHLGVGRNPTENQVREAFRELRVNVEYAHGAVRPLVLCITSPAAGEGKSFVSTNLAIAFAGLGRRTLLIDGDTRRGNAHELLRLQRKPGLTDFLATSHGATAHVQQSTHENLSLLACGSRSAGSPELLNSRGMQDILASARARFDVVILDSPPLSAGADAFVLAAHAGSLLLVLRSGTTNKGLTMIKLEPLLRLPVRVLGAVLNDFVPSKLYGSYQYYGGYLPGYEAKDEPSGRLGGGGAHGHPTLDT